MLTLTNYSTEPDSDGVFHGELVASRYFDPIELPARMTNDGVRHAQVSPGRRLGPFTAASAWFSSPVMKPFTEDCDYVIQSLSERYFPGVLVGHGLPYLLRTLHTVNLVGMGRFSNMTEAALFLGDDLPESVIGGAADALEFFLGANRVRFRERQAEADADIQFPRRRPVHPLPEPESEPDTPLLARSGSDYADAASAVEPMAEPFPEFGLISSNSPISYRAASPNVAVAEQREHVGDLPHSVTTELRDGYYDPAADSVWCQVHALWHPWEGDGAAIYAGTHTPEEIARAESYRRTRQVGRFNSPLTR